MSLNFVIYIIIYIITQVILPFWLILAYNLSEDRHTIDVIITKFFPRRFTVRYWTRGNPDNENQSDGRTETIDSNIFNSSQSIVRYKTIKYPVQDNLLVVMLATTVSVNKLSSSNR